MIIDFHTHIFPDKIAQKTIDLLAKNGQIEPFSDGTVAGLLQKMEQADVSLAVTLPVVTDPRQFDSINRFAAEINRTFENAPRRLLSFGGIHPKCEQIDQKMAFLRESGFLGVKIHPDYQGTFINDEGYVRILECAKEYDMIVVAHAGVDGAFRDQPVRCPPHLALELIRRVKHSKLVLAHCGANEMPREALETLCGEDVYLDTAFVLRTIGKKNFLAILQKHGADRVLFASDSPWSDIRGDVEIVKSFGLDQEPMEKLFYKNAQQLLGMR